MPEPMNDEVAPLKISVPVPLLRSKVAVPVEPDPTMGALVPPTVSCPPVLMTTFSAVLPVARLKVMVLTDSASETVTVLLGLMVTVSPAPGTAAGLQVAVAFQLPL